MNPKVVIIGHGYTSRLGLIRSLSTIGADISIIIFEKERLKPVDCYSKYVRNVYPCQDRNEKELMSIITEKCSDENQKVFLLPTDDFSASFIDRNLDSLSDHFLLPHIHHQQGAIIEWMNKEKQKALAQSCGLDVAGATNVEIIDGQYHLPSGITYPCFTKTRAYVSGCKGTLHKCSTEEELHKVFDRLSKKHSQLTVMVEDYKKIDTEYAVVGFSDGKEVIIPGVIEILVMAKGGHRGVACQGKIMPVTGFEELIEKFKKMILEIGFVGLFDIDFYLSDGTYYFGEINLRTGGSGTAVMKSGVQLPVMYVYALSNEPYDHLEKDIHTTSVYINERICSDCWKGGYLSTKEFRQMLKSSNIHFLDDEQDKKPAIIYKRNLLIIGFLRLFRKKKKRS